MTRMGELNQLNRQANMKTVYLNASYFPAVELLSALGTAAILLYGGYQALDLSDDAARNAQIGVVVAFVTYLTPLLRPDPAAVEPLHDLPAGDGGARQDLRPARHRAGPGRQAGRARPAAAARRDRARRRVVLVRADHGRRRRPLGDEGRVDRDPRRRDARAGRRDRRGQVDAGEAGVALLRPPEGAGAGGRARPARPAGAVPAEPARDRAAGGLPVLGVDPGQHRVRAARRLRRGDRGGGRGDRRGGVHPAPAGRASTPRSASAGSRCRPASGS